MRTKSELSLKLYDMMLRLGYPEPFCDQITQNLNTDFTARRMIGYLKQTPKARLEDIADEMLAILSDRAVIMQKKDMEATQAAWNDILNEGFEDN